MLPPQVPQYYCPALRRAGDAETLICHDIQIDLLGIAWTPYHRADDGKLTPART